MKKVMTLVVLVAGAASAWYFSTARDVVAAPEVVRSAVSFGPITETVQAMGTIEPMRRVNVGSQVSGVVKELYADFNSVVRQGQLLAEIEPSLLQVQVQVQEANIERQRSDIANQEMQLADQRKQLERLQALFDRGLHPQAQLDAAILSLKTRESQVESSKKQLVQAEASLAAARLNLSYTKIYSPIDGVVVNRRVDRGQTVQASMTTPSFFMLVTPLQLLKLNAGVDEANIGRVRPGMRVQFTVGTFGSERFTGTVEAIRLNASNNNSVVTYPVWISVPNEDLRLRPGMTAMVYIEVASSTEVARIPNEALRFRPTTAVYAALGVEAPKAGAVRAVDSIGDRVVDPTALRAFTPDEEANTIDELFAPLPKADSRATVWTWDEGSKELASIPVRVGVTDGQMTELISGDIQVGDQLVTGVILPRAPQAGPPRNPLVGNQPRGGGNPPGGGRAGGSR